MTHPEFENNLFLKIHDDSARNKLALLKYRVDCSMYIALIDLNDNTTNLLNLDGYFFPNSPYEYRFNYDANIASQIHNARKKLEANVSEDLSMIYNIFAFEADHENSQILIEADIRTYKAGSNETEEETRAIRYLIIDFQGKILLNNIVVEDSDIMPYEDHLLIFDQNRLVLMGHTSGRNLHFLSTGDLLVTTIDLIDNDTIAKGEIRYDYIACYAINKSHDLIGVVLANPTYGRDSLKILKVANDNSLEVIYNDVYNDHNYQSIAISLDAQEFSVIEYIVKEEGGFPDIWVYTFDLHSDSRKPQKAIDTKFSYRNTFVIDILYYAVDVLCLVMPYKLVFFNNTTGEMIRTISLNGMGLERDIRWAYHVSYGRIFFKGAKLECFSIESDIIQEYPRKKEPDIPQMPVERPHVVKKYVRPYVDSIGPTTRLIIRILAYLLLALGIAGPLRC